MSLTGCQDAIDITQKGELTEEVAFQTVEDLAKGLNIAYSALSNSNQVGLSSIWTDEVGIGYDNGGQGLSGDYLYALTSGSDYASGIYAQNYSAINRANRVLSAATRITPSEDELEKYNDVIATAKFIRAYAHFDLLSYFTKDMTDGNSYGIAIVDYVPSITDTYTRNTVNEVVDFIKSDLNFADANLISRSDNKFANSNVIKALKARMALYTGDYATAESLADELIASFPLANTTQYPNIWTDVVNTEVIFKLERTTNDATIASLWQSKDNSRSGSSFYEVGRSLYNLLSVNDVRRKVIVNLNASTGSLIDDDYQNSTDYLNTDILLINKYPGSEGILKLNDHKIFRVAEMYFIKAEAQISRGALADAAATIQTLVNKRYTSNAPTISFNNAQTAWAGVLEERRIELAFEGFRYQDLKRLGVKANRGLDRDAKDIERFPSLMAPSTDSYKFTLPIPAREIAINPALGSQQNPGY